MNVILSVSSDPYLITVTDGSKPVDKIWGELYDPWASAIELCPEEEETPEPTSFGSVLAFMEMSPEFSKRIGDICLPLMIHAQEQLINGSTNKIPGVGEYDLKKSL
jgi:hypothetical protein